MNQENRNGSGWFQNDGFDVNDGFEIGLYTAKKIKFSETHFKMFVGLF